MASVTNATHSHAAAAATTTAAATTAGATTAAHGAHAEAKAPKSGDPRFIDGSTGEFGQSKTIKQQDGPAYGGQKVEKNQNGNDKKQNNFGVTDANFTRNLGVIADPDSGKPMSYAQTIQSYNAAGAIQELYPETYAKLVKNQDAGKGTVLGGALAIFGITQTDGANGASLTGIDPAEQGAIRSANLGDLGSLRQQVLNTEDFKGREWNRAHHPGSSWTAMKPLVENGFAWSDAALLTGDSMISWSGRVLGSNNQDGDKTGFAADELAGLKYLVLTEQATGKAALESVLGGHAATHLPEDKLTDPKINKFIGLPEGYRPTTKAEIDMVAGRIRQWALQPGVEVDQGEFNKFVKAGNETPAGRALAASGLLANVQFEAEEQNNGGGGGGGIDTTQAETLATEPTGLGRGTIEATGGGAAAVEPTAASMLAPIGGGMQLTSGSTTTTIANLGSAGSYQVIDTTTGTMDKELRKQLMTAIIEMLYDINNNSVLGDEEERGAFLDGVKKGVQILKDVAAKDPAAVTSLKAEISTALKDGNLSDAERTSLSEKLGELGLEELAGAIKDGTADEKELATINEKIDGAASAKLEKDLDSALDDGKLTAEERTGLEGRVGKEALDAVEAGIKDGVVDTAELKAIAASVEREATAGPTDAKDGAKAAADGTKVDETKPAGPADDAKSGAKATPSAEGAEAGALDGSKAPAGADTPADGAAPAADGAKSGADGAKPAADSAKPAADAKPAAGDAPKPVDGAPHEAHAA